MLNLQSVILHYCKMEPHKKWSIFKLKIVNGFKYKIIGVFMSFSEIFSSTSMYTRGGQSIGPRAGSGPRARFWWAAEGFPNVKGCGPRKRATEVFFFKMEDIEKIEKLKIERNAD